jgi:maltooligosyltrehalose trehalohydrolase
MTALQASDFGAQLTDGHKTHFRLWAPAQSSVTLDFDDGSRALQPRGGWFDVDVNCGSGTHYHYRLQDGLVVPDPASRRQDGDVHGSSVVVDPNAYRWQTPQWRGRPWHEAVFYELHVGLLGGFSGVKRNLARLADLGFTAIELMPIAEFPGARNWGYDGVLPFAPECSYGTPDDLKSLVDTAHSHGLMVFLDVVYNHFGPDGNYLRQYAPQMFRDDATTPWGPAIDFRRREVRRFFIENALYWLTEFRFDGLRLDAVHAITESDWLEEMAKEVRSALEPSRYVHLVLENDDNTADYLAGAFDAQWNDDSHHVLHVLLTGEHDGYYGDYTDQPAARLARCLKEGFDYQGEPSRYRGEKPRGTPSLGLAPTAFVLFLQNHDQVGNRAFGERLTTLADPTALEAAIALQMLCPQIPLVFMGEETASRSPFLFFTDHNEELAAAVRVGRRREFANFLGFSDEEHLAKLPDPNARETFHRSRPVADRELGAKREALYRRLLAVRQDQIVPRLPGTRALDARAIGAAAVIARWRMGDGTTLTIATNLGTNNESVPALKARPLFATTQEAAAMAQLGVVRARATIACLEAT